MSGRAPAEQGGFTYLGLLTFIVVLGILLTVVSRVWSFSAQRDKEAELLWIGDQYRQAIAAYYSFGAAYPLTLDDLLVDNRSPVARHHLRQLYRDPMTNENDWTLVKDPTGVGIMGVASSSKLKPIKQRNFPDVELGFADKDCYCDWKFIYYPANVGFHRYSAPGQGQFTAPAPAPTIVLPVTPTTH